METSVKEEIEKLLNIATVNGGIINAVTIHNSLSTLSKEFSSEQEVFNYFREKGIEVDCDDIEVGPDENTVTPEPFDPTKIDIEMKTINIDAIVKRLKNGEIDLDTDFQRKAGLWKEDKKSQLIESLLLKIPLPAFYFDATDDDRWLIIDGLQRLTAFNEYLVKKQLKLVGLEFFKDYNAIPFDKLPRSMIRRIEETLITIYIVKPGTPENVKYNIFKRINTGGLELTGQEIRNALYHGPATELLAKMANSKIFKDTTCRSIRQERMMDREFALRFVGVCFYGTDKYNGSPEDFLNRTMKYIKETKKDEEEKIESSFYKVMTRAKELFGIHAFRKMSEDGNRRPINKAVFESWCYNLFLLSDIEFNYILKKKEILKKEFIGLCSQYSFVTSLRASDKAQYQYRINEIRKLIGVLLNDKKY